MVLLIEAADVDFGRELSPQVASAVEKVKARIEGLVAERFAGDEGRPMNLHQPIAEEQAGAVEIRVRGRVQGVGFRPTVWRIARELGLMGEVLNDADGVLVRVGGSSGAIARFLERMESERPPLGRIDQVETRPFGGDLSREFRIAESVGGTAHTQVTPDAATCKECAAEVLDPFARRYRYPLPIAPIAARASPSSPASLTTAKDHDGGLPHVSGVRCGVWRPRRSQVPRRADRLPCVRAQGAAHPFRRARVSFDQHSMLDDVDAVCSLLQKGEIVAIKGLGGYQLACDATDEEAVARLRSLKQRDAKPFALMARDLDIIGRYCALDGEARRVLQSPEAPIVILSQPADLSISLKRSHRVCEHSAHAADDPASSPDLAAHRPGRW